MNIFFHPEAETEFLQTIDYYEASQTGLGYDFALEIRAVIQRVSAFPMAWPIIDGEIRRALSQRFPYGVLYRVDDRELYILAVMHLHREPDYWKTRKIG